MRLQKGTHLRPLSPISDDHSANPFETTGTLDPEPNAENYCQSRRNFHKANTVGERGFSLHSGLDELELSYLLLDRLN